MVAREPSALMRRANLQGELLEEVFPDPLVVRRPLKVVDAPKPDQCGGKRGETLLPLLDTFRAGLAQLDAPAAGVVFLDSANGEHPVHPLPILIGPGNHLVDLLRKRAHGLACLHVS